MDVATMDQDAGAGSEAGHDYAEKAKARKSGPSLMRKCIELADKANVFASFVYWDPTHKCHRVAAQMPEGETLPDLNRLVAEALAGRLPEPRMAPKKVPSRRQPNTTGAGRQAGKPQQVARPLRRSTRMRRTGRSDATSSDVYIFRGDSEGAPEAEITNGGSGRDRGSGSDSHSAGSGHFRGDVSSCSDSNSILVRSSLTSSHEVSVAFESDLSRPVVQGGGTEAAADCSLPGSMEASVVGGHVPVIGQSTEAMSFADESLLHAFGADMAVTEAAAAPSLSIAQQADTSTTALPQPEQYPVSTRASLPRPGILASDAWRRMAQNALGIVNLLLTSEPRSMQAELGLSPLQRGWVQPGQVAIR
ncbi:hypothetical protein NQ176_g1692 [Zarea fungicola]|uniref:Uncharacterized protein n=1 Tax=Zarea fungicola TaxID=93591 RepID=A0ACC1NSS2_9HYPO|nr:hypothetical protein NQ176_g1692 [Lecanicillium fungicola]